MVRFVFAVPIVSISESPETVIRPSAVASEQISFFVK
jgi:hypothetical protein